ncbi:MAG: transglutaminase-like domain-containing protein [Eubacteriales bacterium]|nr:transglutaminase-like domain-containing protein [Eubacteriales bacterium]
MKEYLDFLACPLPEDIRRLVDYGDFDRAERLIALRIADPRVTELMKKRLKFQHLMNRDLKTAYPYTPEDALLRLQAKVRDIGFEEMESLRDDGTLDWIYVDGQVRYKDDCVASLIKTRPDMNNRILDEAALQAKAENSQALDGIIKRMKEKGGMRLRYRMRITLTPKEGALRPGEILRVHLPLPVRTAQSLPLGAVLTEPTAKHVAPDTHPQRTAYFEEVYTPGTCFSAEFEYEIDARYASPDPHKAVAGQPSFDTTELLPQIALTPFIRLLAEELAGEETNPLIIARAFYDHITKNAVYRYVRAYRSVASIPEYFGTGLRGDCGMHALLFIALCRAKGIPAQWQAGWFARPGHLYSHDWARFYVAPYGWLYADGSFGGSAFREGHLDRWNFYFGNLEPWRMVANSDFQQAFDPPRRHPRNDPYDNQSGEAETENRALQDDEYTTRRECLHWEELPLD